MCNECDNKEREVMNQSLIIGALVDKLGGHVVIDEVLLFRQLGRNLKSIKDPMTGAIEIKTSS
jgi:hypothetical protein